MLQVIQNGLSNAKTSMTDNTLLEKNVGEQFSSSFDEIFQSAQTDEKQKIEAPEISMTANEESKIEDFSDVMNVCDEDFYVVQDVASECKKNNAQERPDAALQVNKKSDKGEKTFSKTELTSLLPKKQEKKTHVRLEINLERLPKNVSLKIKDVIAKKSGEKADIEGMSRDIGTLLLSQFQMKEKNTNKKVTSETFAKNVTSATLKGGKLILQGSEKLKQLKIAGKVESSNKENHFSMGLKELLLLDREQLTKNDVSNNKADNKIETLSVNNNAKTENFHSGKTAATAEKDKNQKMLLSKTKDTLSNAKDVLEIKNGIKENFSMPISNKPADSEALAKSFQEQKVALYEQVTKQTKVLLTSDKVSFSTFIRPEEIGRVDFKFVTKDGKVNGKIILQNQDAADLFRSNVEDLRAVFQRANVELDKLEIQIAGRQPFEAGNFDFSGNSDNAAGERNSQAQEKMADASLHHAVKAFDDGAAITEKSAYSGNGIHLVI